MPMITETNATLGQGHRLPLQKETKPLPLNCSFQATAMFTVKGIFEGIVCLPLKRDTAIFSLIKC